MTRNLHAVREGRRNRRSVLLDAKFAAGMPLLQESRIAIVKKSPAVNGGAFRYL